MSAPETLAELRAVSRRFGGTWLGGDTVLALDRVSLEIRRGEVLGLVGESGSGKSTLARVLLALLAPTSGSVHFEGRCVATFDAAKRRQFRAAAQLVFQNPSGALTPHRSVGQALVEPLEIHGIGDRASRRARAITMLIEVGLPMEMFDRLPSQMSGGQRQRVALARALVLDPHLLVADEPVASLDVSIQAQILELLQDLRRRRGLTILFVSHDLAVVNQIADRVAVMHAGCIVELGPRPRVLFEPAHPYTRSLLGASRALDPTGGADALAMSSTREATTAVRHDEACPYCRDCELATAMCERRRPTLQAIARDHAVACHAVAPQR